jgi:hypothetical protein
MLQQSTAGPTQTGFGMNQWILATHSGLLMQHSCIIQQGLPFPISADDITLLSKRQLLSESTRNCNGQGGDKKNRHDHKGEDPLQRDYFNPQLVNGKC